MCLTSLPLFVFSGCTLCHRVHTMEALATSRVEGHIVVEDPRLLHCLHLTGVHTRGLSKIAVPRQQYEFARRLSLRLQNPYGVERAR